MKIAINTRLMLRHRMDGIGWFELETTRRMAAAHPEHEFHLLFDRSWDKEFVQLPNLIPHAILPQARRPILMRAWNDYAVPLMLRRLQPDVYVSPDAQGCLRTSVPQLIVIHDINFAHYPADIPPIYSKYMRAFTPRWARKATRLATVSEFSKQDIAATYQVSPEKIDVVYNGVNERFAPISASEKQTFRGRFTEGEDYFLFVGTIHPRKNLQRLLPAFDAFKARTGSKAKLLVVGNSFYHTPEIATAFENMAHRADVLLPGRMSAEELHHAIGAALANVYISYFEGFGIPILEGFRCGTPVITSNITSMPEVAGDAALLVNPMDVNDISNALQRVAEDASLRERLIQSGFQRQQNFSWQRTSELLWQSIQKTLEV